MDYINLFIKAVFVENILLSFFLGMCSFLACSSKVETSIGLGTAVIFVLTLATPINWLVSHLLLNPGALSWLGMPNTDLTYLSFISYIAVIAALVQIVEMSLDRFSQKLYVALGIFVSYTHLTLPTIVSV